MKSLTVLCVSILAVQILTLDAESQVSECQTDVKVRRNKIYNVSLGSELRVNCPITFCNNSPPTVFWHKLEKNDVPVNISRGSHIRQEWETLEQSEGISFLIFKNILRSDSGQYRCESGATVGHIIIISVSGGIEPTTVTWTTLEPEIMTEDTFWPYVHRVVGIMAFVLIAMAVYVMPKRMCKAALCRRESKITADPDSEKRISGSIPGSSVPI